MSGNHPNYSIIEIGPNTKKYPGDLSKLAVTQNSSGKPSALSDVKKNNSQMSKIIIIMIITKMGRKTTSWAF